MSFEDKKFCRISTLEQRWDCSKDLIYDLLSKQVLLAWHPEGRVGKKGIRIDVKSILAAEANGYITEG